MMNVNLINTIKLARDQYESARKANMGVADKKQALSNILLSHVDEIIDTALDADFLMKKKAEAEGRAFELQKKLDELTKDSAEPNPENEQPAAKKKIG